MRRFLLAFMTLFCLGICIGCEPEVAPQEESEFTGEDQEAQMEAMESVGEYNE